MLPNHGSSLVKVSNTITLATYQPFFLWSRLTVYNYSTLSKLIHCLVSLTCTKFNLQNSGIVVFRTNDVVLCKRYVTKILWLKKLICTSWIRMLRETDCKVLVWHNILFERLLFCLWEIWVANLVTHSINFGLEGGSFINFSADLNLVFVESFMRFVWSNIGLKSSFYSKT